VESPQARHSGLIHEEAGSRWARVRTGTGNEATCVLSKNTLDSPGPT
jgi:hypothetical protein